MADERWKIRKKFLISAGHNLKLNYESKCKNKHGHNWVGEVQIVGSGLDENGMLIDFVEIKKVLMEFDHVYLNDIVDINPTAENLVKEIAERLNKRIKELGKTCRVVKVKLWETPDNLVEYEC